MSEIEKRVIFSQTVRIESLAETEVRKENIEKTVFKMTGQDSEKIAKVVLVGPNSFPGVNPGDLVEVSVKTSQMSLQDFEPKEEKEDNSSNTSEDQKNMVKDLKAKGRVPVKLVKKKKY